MTQTILSCNIAGISHARPDFSVLSIDDEVTLVLEPQNEFDPRAIRVQHKDAGKLGYVPKESTICIRDAVDNGFELFTRLQSFNDSGKWPKIHLVVTIDI